MESIKKFLIDSSIPEPNSGCWLWLGSLIAEGYGGFQRTKYAHIEAYKCFKDKIPQGCEVHHICQTRLCINPEHLEALTKGVHRKRHFEDKKACRYGHEVNIYRSYRDNGRYYCKECARLAGPKNKALRREYRRKLKTSME